MQKFIVTADGRLKFGNVHMHKDLLSDDEWCIGGGLYEWDYVRHRMLLSGKSYDFGRVKWSMVSTLLLPASLRGFDIFYEDIPLSDFAALAYDD